MTHVKVYEQFKEQFPQYADRAEKWFPNGKNSIRIRMINGLYLGNPDLIFSYNGKKNWRLETMEKIKRKEKNNNGS